MKFILIFLYGLGFANSFAQQNFPLPEDVASIDGIIKAYYEVVSGPEGPKQVARDKSLHHADAHVMVTGEDKDGIKYINSMTLEAFHEGTETSSAFYENEINRIVESFGNITHVWSTYEYKTAENGPIKGRGINSIQLYFDGVRYWILGWVYDSERKNNPLPKKYLKAKN